MTVRPGTVTIIRGGRLLDARAHRADPGDILVTGDTISEIGPPGLTAPAGTVTVDARGMLLHPGLINAHTHAHGNLAKGMGDRWTLELLLTAAPWIIIRGCADLAKEYGVGLHSHVAESKVQAIVGLQRYGKTLTAHLDDLGALGPHFTVAHGVWLDHDDMKRLGDHGASVAHNPGSNMRLGNGFGDMKAMLERRVSVGIGTDGANCSDNQNVFEAMRLASLVSKGQSPDVDRWVTTDEVVVAATEGSARALGFAGKLGRLAPGYLADIVFLDLKHPNWIPTNDPTNQLVHTENGGAVTHVMIGGRMIVEHRRLTTVDLEVLARDAEAARQRLESVNAPARALYERLAPVVGRFCPGLAHVPYHAARYVGGR